MRPEAARERRHASPSAIVRPDRDSAGPLTSAVARLLLLGAIVVAALVRILTALDAFWLDEIWGYWVALEPTTWSETIRRAHAENAHYLSILWMRALGPLPGWFPYRLPSLLLSLFALPLALRVGRRIDAERGPLAYGLLFGFSFLAIQYAAEARGYAAVGFHALAQILLLGRMAPGDTGQRGLGWGWLFGLNAVLGLLAQPLFLMALAPALAWLLAISHRRGAMAVCIPAFGVPLLAVLAAWAAGLASAPMPQGPPAALGAVAVSCLAFGLGLPSATPPPMTAGLATALLAVAGTWLSTSWRREQAVLHLSLVLAPAALLAASGTAVLYERYFLTALPSLLWWLTAAILTLPRRVAPVALGVALALQASHVVPLLRYGRGDYQGGLEMIASRDPSQPLVVGSDHPFRNGLVLAFYASRLDPPRPIRQIIIERSARPGVLPPRWVINHRIGDDIRSPPPQVHAFGSSYRLVRWVRKYGLSGLHWGIYERERPETEG